MITEFTVRRAENGYVIHVDRTTEVERDGKKFYEYTNEQFVFESPAKLTKALKLFATDLKTNINEPVPF